MMILTMFTFCYWMTTIAANHLFNSGFDLLTGAMLIIPCGLVSLVGTKILVFPLSKVFKRHDEGWNDRTDLIGQTAFVDTLKLDQEYGQIVIQRNGLDAVINARNETGQKLKKGDVVNIVSYDKDQDVCLVELAKQENI